MESKSNENVKWGREDVWKLILCIAISEDLFVSNTSAMQIYGVNNETTLNPPGVLLKVSTHQINPDGSHVISESVTHIPCCRIMEEYDNDGKVVSRYLQTSYE